MSDKVVKWLIENILSGVSILESIEDVTKEEKQLRLVGNMVGSC